MNKAYQVPTTLELLNNLETSTLTIDAAISNAAKAYQRRQWFAESLRENRLTDFFKALNLAINELPEGTIEVQTLSATTGKAGTKKINKRDIAKRSFTTAYNGAVKDLGSNAPEMVAGKKLSWKLSVPFLEDVTETAMSTRIARLIAKHVDDEGANAVIAAFEQAQRDSVQRQAERKEREAVNAQRLQLLNDIKLFTSRGMTEEQAQEMACTLNNVTPEQLQVAIG